MKTLKRYCFYPLLWVSGAVFVAVLSLFSAHVSQTKAVTNIPSPSPQNEASFRRPVFDTHYPGSLAYLAVRAQERFQQSALRPEELPAVFIYRAQDRTKAAKQAWNHGDEERSLQTLQKAHVYLHRAVHECQNFESGGEKISQEISDTSDELLSMIQQFEKDCETDQSRSNLTRISREIYALNL